MQTRKKNGFNPWVGKIPWSRKWQPTPVFLSGKSLGQRRLEGYSPGVCKESDTTKDTYNGWVQGAISFKFCMAQNRVHLGEYAVSLRRMCNLLWLGEVGYECQLNSIDWWGCSVQLCPYWYFLPAGFVSCWQRGTEVSSYNSGFICFSLQFYQFLPHVFCCSVVRSMHSKNCYMFLENWPLYLFVMLLFIPDTFLSLNSALKLI